MNVHWFVVVVILLMYFIYKFNETLISWVILVGKITLHTSSKIIFHCYFYLLHVVIQNLPRFELFSMCCEEDGVTSHIFVAYWECYVIYTQNFENIHIIWFCITLKLFITFYTSSHVCMLTSLINAYFDYVSVSQVLVILKYETFTNKLIVVDLVPIWWITLVIH
jgi:hypothetical protein